MNKQRRAQIAKIAETVSDLSSQLTELRDEEQEYLDNMPGSLQGSEKAQAAENAVSNLDDAINGLEEVVGPLEEAQE